MFQFKIILRRLWASIELKQTVKLFMIRLSQTKRKQQKKKKTQTKTKSTTEYKMIMWKQSAQSNNAVYPNRHQEEEEIHPNINEIDGSLKLAYK